MSCKYQICCVSIKGQRYIYQHLQNYFPYKKRIYIPSHFSFRYGSTGVFTERNWFIDWIQILADLKPETKKPCVWSRSSQGSWEYVQQLRLCLRWRDLWGQAGQEAWKKSGNKYNRLPLCASPPTWRVEFIPQEQRNFWKRIPQQEDSGSFGEIPVSIEGWVFWALF